MRICLVLIIILIVSSCSLFSNKPKGLLEDEELVNLLVDIHFADAVVSIKGYRVMQDSATINLLYDDIMKKHNVTRKQFDETIQYYSKNVTEYDRIYDQVLEILSKKQKQFNEDELRPPKMEDL